MPAEAKRAREEHAAQLKQPTGRSRRRSELGPERPRPAPAGSTPASCPSPTGPALRANPFPEVTDLICRLPLPTLFYRQRLFTLETCCGYGYGPARNSNHLPRIFKGRRECTGHRGKRGALRRQRPYLRASRFQGVRPLQRKENSSRGSRRRLLVRLRYRALDTEVSESPCPGSGILTRFPFDRIRAKHFCLKDDIAPASERSFPIS